MTRTATYVHRPGLHCESACQVNILAANGHDVAEDDVFGLDGGFGLSFFPAAGGEPDVVVGKQEIMPLRAARLMGIEVQTRAPRTAAGLAELLDDVPAVMVRVDIGRLPHWGLQGRAAFGGYFVNVVRAVDGSFEVSDPALDAPVVIDGADLDDARGSTASPPLNPNHVTHTFGPGRADLRLDLVGPVAVRTTCRNVLKPGNRNLGVPGLKALRTTARRWPETKQGDVEDVDLDGRVTATSALGRQLAYLGRQIESFGTGGGLFRPMVARFLDRVADATGCEPYRQAAGLFAASGERWHQLGVALLAGAVHGSSSELHELVGVVIETAEAASHLETQALAAVVAL